MKPNRTPWRGAAPVAGVRIRWRTTGDGDFHCPDCGGDRSYLRREGDRRWALLGLPLLSRGTSGPVLECAACRGHFAPDEVQPTTTRLSAMLRDASRMLALAVLTAGGDENPAVRETAAAVLREAGHTDCRADHLPRLRPGTAGLHDALAPPAPYLVPAGREHLLLTGARIALADGPYSTAERAVLTEAADALGLTPTRARDLLDRAGRAVY